AVGEGGGDVLGVRRVALPFLIPIASIPDQPCHAVAGNGRGAEDLGELAGANAAPQIDLEQPILGGDKSLRKEEIFGAGGVNVRHSPTVTQNLDRAPNASKVSSAEWKREQD